MRPSPSVDAYPVGSRQASSDPVAAPSSSWGGTVQWRIGNVTAPVYPPAPVRRAQVCPVCNGRGTVAANLYTALPMLGPREACRSCGSRGYVVV